VGVVPSGMHLEADCPGFLGIWLLCSVRGFYIRRSYPSVTENTHLFGAFCGGRRAREWAKWDGTAASDLLCGSLSIVSRQKRVDIGEVRICLFGDTAGSKLAGTYPNEQLS
jgi:hypothetical protein